MLAAFSRKYPEVSFSVHTHDSSEVIKRVLSGEWPIGIVGQKPDEADLVAQHIADDEIMVVAAQGASWLPGKESVSLTEAASLPWIMRERGSATRRVLEEALEGVGHSIQDLLIRCQVEGPQKALLMLLMVSYCFTSRLSRKI